MKNLIRWSTAVFIFALTVPLVFAQTTAFTFQGKLSDLGNPANGIYQMEFKMFDALAGGNQIGTSVSNPSVAAAQGVFTTTLDFGANAFPGADRFLEIAVRRSDSESYVTLSPRQQISSSPYAIKAISAERADTAETANTAQTANTALDAERLGGVPAGEYLTNTAALGSFIRNGTTAQTANFNVSGNGLIGGLVGLGTPTNGFFRLDSAGPIRAFSDTAGHFVAQTTGGTNSWARYYMRTPNRSWLLGTSQNFNGDQFYLVDETAGQTRFAVSTAGNVGINNSNPLVGLDIRGTNLQTQQRITDNTSNNTLVLQGGAGENTKVTGFNYNTNTAVPLYLSVDGANTVMNSRGGHVIQPGFGFGLPKAMLFVLANGTIARCYNGVTGATSGDCGFTVTSGQVYNINFGFNVSGRFFSVVTHGADGTETAAKITAATGNQVGLKTFFTDTGEFVVSDFFLIVY